MWRFVPLVISLLAKISYAEKCALEETPDVTFIADDLVKFVGELPVPMLEYQDHSAGQYIKMVNNAFKFYGRSLVNNLYDQAVAVGEQLVEEIEDLVYKFEKAIKSIAADNIKSNCLEEILKEITDQLHVFLDLKPGNGKFKRPTLPPLPELQIKLESRTARRTAKEIFPDFEATINNASSQVYAYMAFVIRTGWEKLRITNDYEAVRKMIYKEILNESVLDGYERSVKKIHKQRDLVRNNVSHGAWKAFEKAREDIIRISNDVKAASENENEHRSSSAHCAAPLH